MMINDEEAFFLINKYGTSYGVKNRYLDVVAAIEALGKEVEAGSTDNRNEFKMSLAMIDKMGDCLFALLALCEETEIIPDKALGVAINKFEIMHAKRDEIDVATLMRRVHGED